MSEEEIKKANQSEDVQSMKRFYNDFKEVTGEVFGDAEATFKKHKLLLILAFLGFLYYRNKQFSIAQFVEKLEKSIKGDQPW